MSLCLTEEQSGDQRHDALNMMDKAQRPLEYCVIRYVECTWGLVATLISATNIKENISI
jgi:hypothetical protein